MARVTNDFWTVDDPVEFFPDGTGPGPAPTPPVVSNVSPSEATQLERGTPLSFDVTDDSGAFRRIILKVQFAGMPTREFAHDGDTFAPMYLAGSTRETITGGYRYTLVRAGGWPAAPTITPYAIDALGAENA